MSTVFPGSEVAAFVQQHTTLSHVPVDKKESISRQEKSVVKDQLHACLLEIYHGNDIPGNIQKIADVLFQYPSSKGIPRVLLQKIYLECIRQFCAWDANTCSVGDFEVIFRVLDLIREKFPNKIEFSSFKNKPALQETLVTFFQSVCQKDNEHFSCPSPEKSLIVTKIWEHIIEFHIQFQISVSGSIAVQKADELIQTFQTYQSFCQRQGIVVKNALVHIVQFIFQMRHDLYEHVELMNEIFRFTGAMRNKLPPSELRSHFDTTVILALKKILSLNHKPREKIIKKAQIASKFANHLGVSLQSELSFFLQKIRLHVYSDHLSQETMQHDYHDLVELYSLFVLTIHPPRHRALIFSSLISNAKEDRRAYYLLNRALSKSPYLTFGQMKDLISYLFYDVRFNAQDFKELELESVYDIMITFFRMGPGFFTTDLRQMSFELAQEIYRSDDSRESPQSKFACWVIQEIHESFPEDFVSGNLFPFKKHNSQGF